MGVLLETSWLQAHLTGSFKMQGSVIFEGGSMDVLSRYYHQSEGLNSDWALPHVQLDVQRQPLTKSLEFVGTRKASNESIPARICSREAGVFRFPDSPWCVSDGQIAAGVGVSGSVGCSSPG
jgi:hypothetical protein